MQINIDWLTFTVKRVVGDDDVEIDCFNQAMLLLHNMCPDLLGTVISNKRWKALPGRKPYRASFACHIPGIVLFVHPALDHMMFEFTGQGCQWLGEQPFAPKFLDAVKDRLTRLDLACDMLTDVTPHDFVAKRAAGRFKSDGHVREESGSTEYVGSRKSDRFACVYRYNDPHPRAHLLRCEFRLRSDNAKLYAAAILEHGAQEVANVLGRAFGWQHEAWSVVAPSELEIRAYRPDRKIGNTLFWLNETIAPLLKRLHDEGKINATDWLQNVVFKGTLPPDAE